MILFSFMAFFFLLPSLFTSPLIRTAKEFCINKVAFVKNKIIYYKPVTTHQNNNPTASKVPPLMDEVINKIFNLSFIQSSHQENALVENATKNVTSSLMLIPNTISTISFIQPYPFKYCALPYGELCTKWKKEYSPNDRISPEIDIRLMQKSKYNDYHELHMTIDSENISSNRYLSDGTPTHIKFLIKNLDFSVVKYDGFNTHKVSIITTTNQTNFCIYLFEKYTYKIEDFTQMPEETRQQLDAKKMKKTEALEAKHIPLLVQDRGCLHSCMLYPDENKVLCTISNSNPSKINLSLYEIKEKKFFHITTSQVDCLFKKTVYLGPYYKEKESYLGLTEKGKIALIWLETHTGFNYSLITHYDQLYKGKQVERKFIDIATDQSVQQNKIRSRIAFLNTDNEVFICDLLQFKKPTLLLATEKPLEAKNDEPFRLLYDKNQYAIIWKDKQSNNLTRVIVSYDNFEQLKVKTLLKYTLKNPRFPEGN